MKHIETDHETGREILRLTSQGWEPEAAAAHVARMATTRQEPRRAPEAAKTGTEAGSAQNDRTEANTDALTIRVDWTPPPGTGMNDHKHWRHRHKHSTSDHQIGREAAESQVPDGWQCPDMPVMVAVIHWEAKSRKRDPDNALSGTKFLVDGICMGLGFDDRRFVTSMAFQRFDPAKRGYTEVTIRPATKGERRLTA